MSITLTKSAAERVRNFIASRGQGIGLRLGIRKTGCSGYAYVVNYADAVEEGDVTLICRGPGRNARLACLRQPVGAPRRGRGRPPAFRCHLQFLQRISWP
jgi:hypothetical protein